MGGKHLRKLRAEKSKIHLKKKKKLPKGQNVTPTTFKVKKILTVEQLKKVNHDEPVSNWNVPLKDLLIRLNHYNMTSRLNGLTGIKEILIKYPEILQGPSLKPLLSRLLDLLTDEEHKIRMIAMDVLSYMFSLIPNSALLPFYGIFSVHLGCAMTHRDTSVQLDSLKFIDIMINYCPEALKHNFWSAAENFIRILKKLLNESHCLPSRGSKADLETFKTETFSRFYLFISAGYSSAPLPKQAFSAANVDLTSSDRTVVSLRRTANQYKQVPDLSLLFINSESRSATLTNNSREEFRSLCSAIMPLVFEMWIEFCPDRRFSESVSECVLAEGTAALLCVLLKIVMFLFEGALAFGEEQTEHWFIETHGPMFKKCFTCSFPYLLSSSRKKQSPKKSFESVNTCSDSCVLQNLIICLLSYSFKFVSDNCELETKMENYISWVLSRENSAEIEILSKVVDAGLKTSNRESAKHILIKVVNAYEAAHSSELRRELSKALVKVVLDEGESVWREEQSIANWMMSLPELMCKRLVFEEVVEAALRLVNGPAGAEILKEVEAKALEIMSNMENFEAEKISEIEGQKMIANILYRCRHEVLEELLKDEVLSKQSYSLSLKDYIKKIFSHKLLSRSGLPR